jgi:cellulose synthase/poly-beta-1,6-N-acetylglucosamine synthase-like glycosyltransferase
MKISVVIPVYKEPKMCTDIVRKILANDYADKEVVAVVDGEMSPAISEALAGREKEITIVYPGEHAGKARALNAAVGGLATDAILFLDNDVELPDDPSFLRRIAGKLETHDIVDLAKEAVVESIYSAMISYEYESNAMASSIFSSLAKRSPALVGSAFAVRKALFDELGGYRPVVHEDVDFGARAFNRHARYLYANDLKVRTTMPNDLRSWITQRKRWTLINCLWFKEDFLPLVSSIFKQPSLIWPLFVLALPTLISLILFIVLDSFNLTFAMPVLLMMALPHQFFAGIFLWLSHYSLSSQGFEFMLLGFAISVLTYFVFSRIVKFRFNVFEYALYYALYVPFLVIINVTMFIAMLGKKRIALDWKV